VNRTVHPRYGRIAAFSTSVLILLTTALGALGVLSTGSAQAGTVAERTTYQTGAGSTPSATTHGSATGQATSAGVTTGESATRGTVGPPADLLVPVHSGSGRRIVFSQHLQRVWLVAGKDAKPLTYLVSGSLTDNLQPGSYAVTQRERHAIGIDDSGAMQYFVVFTAGPTGAAIGFHSIPVKNGQPVQTKAQLGTPMSHGCIRQATPDAIALWSFAPVGTKVVVVA
jgi:L,D-transpeptidase catalytic domain